MDTRNADRLERLDVSLNATAGTLASRFDELMSRSDRQNNYLTTQFDKVESLAQNQVIAISAGLEALKQDTRRLGDLEQNTKGLGAGIAAYQARVEEHSQAFREDGRKGFANIQWKMDMLSDASEEQYTTLEGLLRQLLLQGATNSHWEASELRRTDLPSSKVQIFNEVEGDNALSNSIHRILRLASKKGKSVSSSAAQELIGDLEEIIKVAFKRRIKPDLDGIERKRKRDEMCPLLDTEMEKEMQHAHDLKRIRGILNSSQCFEVSGDGQLPQSFEIARY